MFDMESEEGFAAAVTWARLSLKRLKDGGVLIIPRSMSAVRVVSHRTHTVEMIGVEREDVVADIIRLLGWRVVDVERMRADQG
jgi:glycine cleavage system regulatory protein